MDKRNPVRMTIPKIGFFAHVCRRVGGGMDGPQQIEESEHRVPSEDRAEAEAYLREKGVRYDYFLIFKRWTITVTTESGEEIELKSDPVS